MSKLQRSFCLAAILAGVEAMPATWAQTLDSPFIYQGQLQTAGIPLDGFVDLQFALWDAETDGSQFGDTYQVDAVSVVDGMFTTELDFGTAPFHGYPRWLEIAVAYPSGSGAFTTLSPRQALRATPYALHTRGVHVTIAGNVGIGTASPSRQFEVSGRSKFTSSDNQPCMYVENHGSGNGIQVFANNAGYEAAAVYAVNRNSGAGVYAESYDGYAGYFTGTLLCEGNVSCTGDVSCSGDVNAYGLYICDVPYGNYLNAQINPDTGQLGYDNSTRRDKENIAPLTDDFDRLLLAEPRTYTRPGNPDRWEIGYIAEEFDELGLDKLVVYGKDGVIHGVNYSRIGLYLLEIVKNHHAQLTTKDAKISDLQTRVEKLEAQLAELLERN